MASKVQICNMALSRLGASTITSLTDGTTEAKYCNTFFDTVADKVMISGEWTSTINRVALAKTTNTPSFDFTNEFQLPVDPFCLRVLNVNDGQQYDVPYKIEKDKLLADVSTIKIRYIGRVNNTDDWDVNLTDAVELLLSSYLAFPITGNRDMAEGFVRLYEEKLMHNLATNNKQGSKDKIVSNYLLSVR